VTEILATLLDLRRQGRLTAHLILGCPDRQMLAPWHEEFELIDTGDAAGYAAALDRCDVVILNYRQDRYYYRVSGVAADAIARRAIVVCPDFPLMRNQLTQPLPVGTLFGSLGDLERAIHEALTLGLGTQPDAWSTHEAARGPAAIAAILDRFVNDQHR
jgi:hypothetical protein